MSDVTPEELRAAGFSGHAGERNDLALRLLCAFNGIDPAKAPPGWKVHPNESTKAAWERVAAVIAQEMADFAALKVDIGMYVRMTSDQADEIERLRQENRELKLDVVAFAAPHSVSYALMMGLPRGCLHPTHYDLLAKAGGRMVDFTRATAEQLVEVGACPHAPS